MHVFKESDVKKITLTKDDKTFVAARKEAKNGFIGLLEIIKPYYHRVGRNGWRGGFETNRSFFYFCENGKAQAVFQVGIRSCTVAFTRKMIYYKQVKEQVEDNFQKLEHLIKLFKIIPVRYELNVGMYDEPPLEGEEPLVYRLKVFYKKTKGQKWYTPIYQRDIKAYFVKKGSPFDHMTKEDIKQFFNLFIDRVRYSDYADRGTPEHRDLHKKVFEQRRKEYAELASRSNL